jgi:hypothetical protein
VDSKKRLCQQKAEVSTRHCRVYPVLVLLLPMNKTRESFHCEEKRVSIRSRVLFRFVYSSFRNASPFLLHSNCWEQDEPHKIASLLPPPQQHFPRSSDKSLIHFKYRPFLFSSVCPLPVPVRRLALLESDIISCILCPTGMLSWAQRVLGGGYRRICYLQTSVRQAV